MITTIRRTLAHIRRPRSVSFKLYALGIPLAVLSGTLVVATVAPYRATKDRIADARADITQAIAAQRAERESNELIWHTLKLVFTQDLANIGPIEESKRETNADMAVWLVDQKPGPQAAAAKTLLAEKAQIDKLVDEVVAAVKDGDLENSSETFYDVLVDEFDDNFADDLHEAVAREDVNIRGAFIRLSGEAGRTESLFGGRLTAHVAETSNDVTQAQTGANFLEGVTAAALEMVEHVLRGDPPLDEVIDEREDSRRILESWNHVYDDETESVEIGEGNRVGALFENFDALTAIENRALAFAADDDLDRAMSVISGPYEAAFQGLLTETEELIAKEEVDITETTAAVASDARKINLLMSVAASAIFLIGGGFVVILGRRISRRLRRLTSAAVKVGSGDLSARVPVDTPDELGELAQAFNAMAENVAESRDRSASLLGRVVGAAEEERTQLAANLHDGPVQRLTALGYDIERAAMHADRGNAAEVAEILDRLKHNMSSQVRDLRRMMVELRPPALDERGLTSALEDYVKEFGSRHSIAVKTEIAEGSRLPEALETTVYRVTQEALTNVAKHSQASSVLLRVDRENGFLILSVQDDGHGFQLDDSASGTWDHFGLDGMEQRVRIAGGEWKVESAPGEGTTVWAKIPIDVETPAARNVSVTVVSPLAGV